METKVGTSHSLAVRGPPKFGALVDSYFVCANPPSSPVSELADQMSPGLGLGLEVSSLDIVRTQTLCWFARRARLLERSERHANLNRQIRVWAIYLKAAPIFLFHRP